MSGLEGRHAIVVGGGSGIGLATARLLARIPGRAGERGATRPHPDGGPESSWVTGQLLTVDGGHTLRSFVDYGSLLDLPDQGAVARGEIEL